MATREQMAKARDTRAGEQDRREATADAAAASAANVPWTPAGVVYLHGDEWVADGSDADSQDGVEPAGFDDDTPPRPAPSLLRRAIPLLWAAALTVAALQHAGEVERRAALREPTPAELDMQDRAGREIKAAWRSMGTVTAVAEEKPAPVLEKRIETVVEDKGGPAVAEKQSEPTAARGVRSEPQKAEHPLVEPVTEVIGTAAKTEAAQGSKTVKAEDAVPDKLTSAAAATDTSEEQPKVDVAAQAVQPSVNTEELKKAEHKGRITTSRTQASRPHAARAEHVRPKRTRVSSTKYVAFDGHSPRYFTIEQPSRSAP